MEAPAPPAAEVAVLDRVFAGLRDRDHVVRLQSASSLQHHVFHTLPTPPPDLAARLWDEIVHTRLSELNFSQTSAAQLGRALAIDSARLRQTSTSSAWTPPAVHPRPKEQIFCFYNYAKYLLPHRAPDVMLAASTALRRIVAAFGARFAAYEIPASLKLLAHDAEASRVAGVLVRSQLVRMRAAFRARVEEVLSHVLRALRNRNVGVWTRAGELLGACCGVRALRSTPGSDILREVLQDAQEELA
ncbi:hypothetical protein PsYK624_049550 [Phanerochaete sordida]|uniref:Uncharacterized protein n=1 Tax=Phanerochaete sordida TaxID=48140 RepID=A0A9P3G5X5_9APHY|nr:hypothetical protein PsYK624_049550 [Phanerochaete sordida]